MGLYDPLWHVEWPTKVHEGSGGVDEHGIHHAHIPPIPEVLKFGSRSLFKFSVRNCLLFAQLEVPVRGFSIFPVGVSTVRSSRQRPPQPEARGRDPDRVCVADPDPDERRELRTNDPDPTNPELHDRDCSHGARLCPGLFARSTAHASLMGIWWPGRPAPAQDVLRG